MKSIDGMKKLAGLVSLGDEYTSMQALIESYYHNLKSTFNLHITTFGNSLTSIKQLQTPILSHFIAQNLY